MRRRVDIHQQLHHLFWDVSGDQRQLKATLARDRLAEPVREQQAHFVGYAVILLGDDDVYEYAILQCFLQYHVHVSSIY